MKKILYLGAYLGTFAAFCIAILAVTNGITAPRIAEIELQNFHNALLQSFPTATDFEIIETEIDYTPQIIKMFNNGEPLGIVYSQEVRGFVDVIRYLVGIDMDGYFTSFIVLSSRETPGFGTRIANDEWLNRIVNQHASTEIDVLSSATVTTAPIIEALTVAYEDFTNRSMNLR